MNMDLMVMEYKRTKDQGTLRQIINEFAPLIGKTVNMFDNAPIGNDVIETRAKILLMEAIASYEPSKGHFASHAQNYMKGMNRIVNNSSIMYIPESRTGKLTAFQETYDDFWSDHNRGPTHEEMADKMSIPESEVKMLSQETNRRLLYGADIEGSIINQLDDEGSLLEFVYNRLDDDNAKKVLEMKMGLHGISTAKTNGEIAARLNMSESNVRKISDKIIEAIRRYE